MARPILALLTDFGLRDHYVGTMKGVALGICPDATLVDITHEIEPQDVMGAALELEASFPYFPAGTTFLVVVDPGVGSTRRAIAAEAGDYRFVGPDNGVLWLALVRAAKPRVIELTNKKYARSTISRTFEGRDRFAPAAAWLARGLAFDSLGSVVDDIVRLELPMPARDGDALAGEAVRIDRFGNVITNIDRATLAAFLGNARGAARIAGRELPVVSTYADVRSGEACALVSSSDHLEVAVNGGSAAHRFSARRGMPVHVRKTA